LECTLLRWAGGGVPTQICGVWLLSAVPLLPVFALAPNVLCITSLHFLFLTRSRVRDGFFSAALLLWCGMTLRNRLSTPEPRLLFAYWWYQFSMLAPGDLSHNLAKMCRPLPYACLLGCLALPPLPFCITNAGEACLEPHSTGLSAPPMPLAKLSRPLLAVELERRGSLQAISAAPSSLSLSLA